MFSKEWWAQRLTNIIDKMLWWIMLAFLVASSALIYAWANEMPLWLPVTLGALTIGALACGALLFYRWLFRTSRIARGVIDSHLQTMPETDDSTDWERWLVVVESSFRPLKFWKQHRVLSELISKSSYGRREIASNFLAGMRHKV